MGSPVNPIVANIYMQAFEHRAINTALNAPRIWRRYVDDTFVAQQKSHKVEFFQHINTMETSIQFTVEEAGPDGSIPFLNILVTPQPDGTFTTKVYRKPTHTNQHLQWDSNHNLASKYSVINTLTHIGRTICFTPELLNNELQHLDQVLRQWKYSRWAINKILQKQQHQQDNTTKKRHNPALTKKKCHIVVPYTQGSSDSFKNIWQRYRIQVHFKGGTIPKNILVLPKDNDNITKKSSVIYWFRCERIDCEDEYIGESSRMFGER